MTDPTSRFLMSIEIRAERLEDGSWVLLAVGSPRSGIALAARHPEELRNKLVVVLPHMLRANGLWPPAAAPGEPVYDNKTSFGFGQND